MIRRNLDRLGRCLAIFALAATAYGEGNSQSSAIWDGGGPDNKWSTMHNWVAGKGPVTNTGTRILFSSMTGSMSVMDVNLTAAQICFTVDAPAVELGGATGTTLTLDGGGHYSIVVQDESLSSQKLHLNLDINNSSKDWSLVAGPSVADITYDGNITVTTNTRFTVNPARTVSLNGVLSGTALIALGSANQNLMGGTIIFGGTNANTMTGGVNTNTGLPGVTLVLSKPEGVDAIGALTKDLGIFPGSIVRLGNSEQINNLTSVTLRDGTFDLNGQRETVKVLALITGSNVLDMGTDSKGCLTAERLSLQDGSTLTIQNWKNNGPNFIRFQANPSAKILNSVTFSGYGPGVLTTQADGYFLITPAGPKK